MPGAAEEHIRENRTSGDVPPVNDPTKNVLDLVNAQALYQDAMRRMEANASRLYTELSIKRLDDLAAHETHRQDGLRAAEAQRLDDLAAMKERYERILSDQQASQMKITSDLVSAQLGKVTDSLSAQISEAGVQQAGLIRNVAERVGKLEQFRWEIGGKSSVADPAIAAALEQVKQISALTQTHTGQTQGSEKFFLTIVQVIGALAAIGSVITVGFLIYGNARTPSPAAISQPVR